MAIILMFSNFPFHLVRGNYIVHQFFPFLLQRYDSENCEIGGEDAYIRKLYVSRDPPASLSPSLWIPQNVPISIQLSEETESSREGKSAVSTCESINLSLCSLCFPT